MDQELMILEDHVQPVVPALDVLYQSQRNLLLIALLSGLSVLLMLLWLLVVRQYMRKTTTHLSESDKRVVVLW